MKKRVLTLLLALSLAISLTAPALAADGTVQPVTPTPPEWFPADEYLIFPGDEVYLPENWAKVLEMREDAASGNQIPEAYIYGLGGAGSAGMNYERALVCLRYYENGGGSVGAFRAAYQDFDYAQNEWLKQNDKTKDETYYQLKLWTARAHALFRVNGFIYKNDKTIRDGYEGEIQSLDEVLSRLDMTLDDFFSGPYMEYISEKSRADITEWMAAYHNRVTVYLDEFEIFEEDDAKPEFQNNRTMVPIRGIAELLGADVSWETTTNEAVLTRAGVTIVLPIGGSTAQVNGQAVELDAPSYVSQNRTMVPLRFVSETFGQSVSWDSETRVARIAEDKSVAGESNLEAWALPMGAMLNTINASESYRSRSVHVFGCFRRSMRLISHDQNDETVIERPYEDARDILSRSWGINGRRDLVETVCRMTEHGHNDSFLEDVAYIKTLTLAEYLKYLSSPSMDSYMFPYTKQLGEKWGGRGILCWDLFRMSNLVQWGYEAGYITYAEALALLEPAARLLCENFSSWDEAYENYLDGYNWWARNDVLGKDIWETERGQVYQEMKNDPERADIFDDTLFTAGVTPVPNLTASQVLQSVRQ